MVSHFLQKVWWSAPFLTVIYDNQPLWRLHEVISYFWRLYVVISNIVAMTCNDMSHFDGYMQWSTTFSGLYVVSSHFLGSHVIIRLMSLSSNVITLMQCTYDSLLSAYLQRVSGMNIYDALYYKYTLWACLRHGLCIFRGFTQLTSWFSIYLHVSYAQFMYTKN